MNFWNRERHSTRKNEARGFPCEPGRVGVLRWTVDTRGAGLSERNAGISDSWSLDLRALGSRSLGLFSMADNCLLTYNRQCSAVADALFWRNERLAWEETMESAIFGPQNKWLASSRGSQGSSWPGEGQQKKRRQEAIAWLTWTLVLSVKYASPE